MGQCFSALSMSGFSFKEMFILDVFLIISESLNNGGETKHAKRQRTLLDLKEQLTELQNKCEQLSEEISNKDQALFKGKEERDKLRYKKRCRWCDVSL